jgi:hypothetical protein
MDDSGQGVVQKNRILSDLGINLLAQGYLGFSAPMLIPILESMITDQSARGKLVILDTIKKVADLMNKKDASFFANLARKFVLAGGTILGLAHTNKHRSAKGKSIYAGTTDIIDDFDCAYMIDVVEDRCGTRVVKFENLKRRGGGVADAAYSYSSLEEDDYLARVLSVKEVDGSAYDPKRAPDPEWSEESIIETLELAIKHTNPPTKMAILHSASLATKLSRQTLRDVLELNTGDDPTEHRWQFIRGRHGRMLYSLLNRPDDPASTEDSAG